MKTVKLKLISMTGRTIGEYTNSNKFDIDLTKETAGAYILHIEIAGMKTQWKVVKE